MGFVFPLFLLAGLSLLIPVLIHLFNLRKYKKIDFPSLRFLRQFVVQNKKMSKVQKRILLISRLLLLLFLVLAFAQPIWQWSKQQNKGDTAWVVYIDNSWSMELKAGQQSLLDLAKKNATDWIQYNEGNSFYVISNDAMYQAQPLNKQEALQAINKIEHTAISIDANQLSNTAIALQESIFKKNITLVAFSDFQQSNWESVKPITLQEGVQLLLYPILLTEKSVSNVYVDTAFMLEIPMEGTQTVPLVSVMRKSGNTSEETTFQLSINGQTRSSKVVSFNAEDSVKYDTVQVQLAAGSWNQIHLHIETRAASFDDDYYMTARITPSMNVLILNQGVSNGYLSAAFAAQSGVQPLQQNLNQGISIDDNKYALVVLQGITQLNEMQGADVKSILDMGGSVALFFGEKATLSDINAGLAKLGPIAIQQIDTSMQQIVDLQSSHPLMRDVLSKIPENVQLPYASYSYKIKAGITAGGQDLMRFRDGSPFISQYNIGAGKLYIFANPLSPDAGNLIHSYYFAPIVHRMAVNNSAGDVYAATLSSNQNFWIPNTIGADKQIFKLTKADFESIPRQQSKGMGVIVFVPETLKEAGFYGLSNGEKDNNYVVGLNYARSESNITPATKESLEATFGNKQVAVYNSLQQLQNAGNTQQYFPFWKVAVLLALLCLFLETYLLQSSRKISNQTATA